jgi:hypothetical protein
MFLYLLYRAMEDVLIIFNSAPAPSPQVIEDLLRKANVKARPLWSHLGTPFLTRQIQCREILDPVVRMNLFGDGNPQAVPRSVTGELNTIFRKHYASGNSVHSAGLTAEVLLIGRTDDRAYEVQDNYAIDVAILLGTVDPKFESRALTRLGKVYGRGSLPLLCMSSVAAMWELCRSTFYKRQISLVSSPRPTSQLPC